MNQNIKTGFTIALLTLAQIVFSQNKRTIDLNFLPVFKTETLKLGTAYFSDSEKEKITFSVFKFYVSHFEFYNKNKLVYSEKNSSFLLDISNIKSLNRKLLIPLDCNYDEIRFYFGIDDTTNNEGIGTGDLDPSKGMYWTWQTGYINLKLEGTCKNSSTADKSFQFHLGGFEKSFSSFQSISLKANSDSLPISIFIDVNAFLEKVALKEVNAIMSPSEKSVQLSKNASKMFHL
jgi:hypothetical protein